MITHEIKKYTSIVWVKVEFGYDREVLYWDGELHEFEQRLLRDYIIFARHGDRRVPTSKIKDFGPLEYDDFNGNLELKLFSLTNNQKDEVKEQIGSFRKNIGRNPTLSEIDKFIKISIDPNFLKKEKLKEESIKYKRLDKIGRFKTFLVIKRQKVSRIITGSFFGFKRNI